MLLKSTFPDVTFNTAANSPPNVLSKCENCNLGAHPHRFQPFQSRSVRCQDQCMYAVISHAYKEGLQRTTQCEGKFSITLNETPLPYDALVAAFSRGGLKRHHQWIKALQAQRSCGSSPETFTPSFPHCAQPKTHCPKRGFNRST